MDRLNTFGMWCSLLGVCLSGFVIIKTLVEVVK